MITLGQGPGQRMRRREFIALAGGAAVSWPLAARAQQKAMAVIGILLGGSPPWGAPFAAAFRQGLGETGYVEGQNLAIEYRWAEGQYDRLPGVAADLASSKVDVIATVGMPLALAAKSVTSTIPIVFIIGTDPVELGLVASLARPGGNLTGITEMATELMPKRLELLSELVPQAGLIALLVNPNNASAQPQMRDVQEAARAKGVQLQILKASTESEIDVAFASLVELQAGALVVGTDLFFGSRRKQLVALASRHAIPAIYELREFDLGASALRTALTVTLPLAAPGLMAAAIFVFLESLDEFTGTFFVGVPDVTTLPLIMFTASLAGNYQIAALILLVPSIAFMLLIERFLNTEMLAKVG